MDLKEYEKFVDKSCSADGYMRDFLAAMGLAGEAGEVLELWKKHLIHNKELTREELIFEMGDVFWYFTLMRMIGAISLEEIMEVNVEKLTKRHNLK